MSKVPMSKVIEHIAKKQNGKLMEAAKKRHDRYMRMSTMTDNPVLKKHREEIAKQTMLMAGEGVRRLNASAKEAIAAFKKVRN